VRAADSGRFAVRAPRASGELCFLLTKTYMDVGNPEVIRRARVTVLSLRRVEPSLVPNMYFCVPALCTTVTFLFPMAV